MTASMRDFHAQVHPVISGLAHVMAERDDSEVPLAWRLIGGTTRCGMRGDNPARERVSRADLTRTWCKRCMS